MDDSEKEDLQKFSDMDDARNKEIIEHRKRMPTVKQANRIGREQLSDAIDAREKEFKKLQDDDEQRRRDAYFKKHGSA